jgi:PPOX class probable F420-dependent enzyme
LKPLHDFAKKLLDGRNFASVATLMPDGSPHSTQTWVDREGDVILINTFEGSQKRRNVLRDPRVSLTVSDSSNPFYYVGIRGHVVEVTFNGAEEHIDKMAKKYMGQDRYPFHGGDRRRVLLRIEPTRVTPSMEDYARRR